MAYYKIYAGLCHADYQGTYEFDNKGQAIQAAYEMARNLYEDHEGKNDIPDYQDCYENALESYKEENDLSPDTRLSWEQEGEVSDWAEEMYEDYVHSWIDYYVKAASNGNAT